MRGKKGDPHLDPADPPRQRANKLRGHGTYDTDRPPVLGVVGRESGHIRLEVVHHTTREELEPKVLAATAAGATVNTDEWKAYDHLPECERKHSTVCHTPGRREWARDDDGDGIREVHDNTLEGIWTGLRNYLRTFRGVHKKYLQQYVSVFQWCYNYKTVSAAVLSAMFGGFTLKET